MTARPGFYGWDDLANVIALTGDANHRHIPGSPDEWEHGYVPLTEAAARSHFGGKVPKGWHAPQGTAEKAGGHGHPLTGDELWKSGEGRVPDVTPKEAAAMKQWWYGHGHQFTNAYLRGRPNALYPDEKAGIALVTGLANRAPAFTRPVLLHRGVMNASHPDLFGPVGSKVGKAFTDPGLMSASADESMARNGYSREATGKPLTVLHIHAPAGSRALRADPALDGDWNEIDKEYTFPAGTRLRVTGDKLTANPEGPGQVRHIDVTVEHQ